jgi:hypothetical protein
MMLSGIDGRSPQARRYRDLVADFADELGGQDRLTQAQLAVVRQAAGVTVQCEAMQTDIVNGKSVDAEQLVRVSNLLARLLGQLGIGKTAAPETKPKRTLRDKLAERGRNEQ